MTVYKYGKIVHVNSNYLILDHNGSGELIYVPNISRFVRDDFKKIFISNIENEYMKVTYGFETFKELVMFEDLISLQGLGPKTAMTILNEGWEKILALIAKGDANELEKINFVSKKIANNIILNYKDKYAKFLEKLDGNFEEYNKKLKVNNTYINQFEDTIKMLGFKPSQIKYALNNVEVNENIEKCVEDAIKLISQHNNEVRV